MTDPRHVIPPARRCPTHPDIVDATHTHCWRCDQDWARTDQAAGIAQVRAALKAAPPPTPTTKETP